MDRIIYKICPKSLWDQALAAGVFEGAPVDHADGFIHFSTAGQVVETASKHFAGQHGLLLLAVEVSKLGDALKYEVSRGGDLFPHLYTAMPLDSVIRQWELENDADGNPVIPDLEERS